MSFPQTQTSYSIEKAALVLGGVVFAYWSVLAKLATDWSTDENYSHGLLVPFVIAVILWRERERLAQAVSTPARKVGAILAGLAVLLLVAGDLGAELFSQRISFVLMLGGLAIYFFGTQVLRLLLVPFALLLLSIPLPQIIFNKIALPLQMWASQMAVWGIRLFDVPTVRNGNVIDILPRGSTQPISLEVVEACSGIRSMVTLVALALILGYFTRRGRGRYGVFTGPDALRTIALMVLAVPVAVITNAARVATSGVMTYWSGKQATESTTHEVSGWIVFVVAMGLLVAFDLIIKRVSPSGPGETSAAEPASGDPASWGMVLPAFVLLMITGVMVNWLDTRAELPPARQPLFALPATLGEWKQKGSEIRFGQGVDEVLAASDYTMREYTSEDGRMANIYVGYYASQRTGATYHSPKNCLPGAGWVLGEPSAVEIHTRDRSFVANRYTIENGLYREVMIYWYEGRGRTEASEYRDKLNTIWDSITRRRTDGAMVRVMTDVGGDEAAATKAAIDLAAQLDEQLSPFVPR